MKKDLSSFCESNERGRDKNKRGEREGEDRLAAMPTHFEILPTLHASPHQPKIHFFAFVLSFLQVYPRSYPTAGGLTYKQPYCTDIISGRANISYHSCFACSDGIICFKPHILICKRTTQTPLSSPDIIQPSSITFQSFQ